MEKKINNFKAIKQNLKIVCYNKQSRTITSHENNFLKQYKYINELVNFQLIEMAFEIFFFLTHFNL